MLRSSWLRTRRVVPSGPGKAAIPSCPSGVRCPSVIVVPVRPKWTKSKPTGRSSVSVSLVAFRGTYGSWSRGGVGTGDRTQVPVPALAPLGLGGSGAGREGLARDEALERPSGEHGARGSRHPQDGASPSTDEWPFWMSVSHAAIAVARDGGTRNHE